MRLLVCGSRYIPQGWRPGEIQQALTNLCFERGRPEIVIQGGANGVDKCAALWARANDIYCEEFPADWRTHGRKAGPIRNQRMIDEGKPDIVVAFPGGKGTADMIRRAETANVPVIRVGYDQ